MNEVYEDLSVIQIKILSLVAWSDGIVTNEEKQFYKNMVKVSPCSDETQKHLMDYIKTSPKIEDVMESIKEIPKEVSVSALRNAYNIAMADGNLSKEEIEIIEKLALVLGVEKGRIDELHKFLDLSYKIELLETKIFKTEF